MTALELRAPHQGPRSSYRPNDLRTEVANPTGSRDTDAPRAAELVARHCGDDTPQVLAMLGLAVRS